MKKILEIQEDFIQSFQEIDDWMMQYEFLLLIGAQLEAFPEEKRDDAHLIAGCQSKVWLECTVNDGRIHILADSEALIVKGIISVAVAIFQDQLVEKVADAKLSYVEDTELKNQISTDRFHGVQSVIASMQKFAADHMERG